MFPVSIERSQNARALILVPDLNVEVELISCARSHIVSSPPRARNAVHRLIQNVNGFLNGQRKRVFIVSLQIRNLLK